MSNEQELLPGTEEVLETTPEAIEAPVEPAVELPPAPEEAPEQRYEYQPTDDQGRPIGGKQVIVYRTQPELIAEFQKRNELLIRKMREQERKLRLGITEEETIAEDAPRIDETLTFAPKSLSADDRTRIARNLLDPERFDEASDELFTAKLGVTPTELTKTITELQQDRITARIQAEATAFAQANPEYVICRENGEAIANWLARHGLAAVRSNFQRAYDTLKPVLVLNEPQPTVVPEPLPAPVTVPVQEPEPTVEPLPEPVELAVPEEPVKPRPVSRVPLSLNKANSEEQGVVAATPGSDIVYDILVNPKTGEKRRLFGLAAINAMPADEYKRRVMTDPNFAKKGEALEKAAAAARRGRR